MIRNLINFFTNKIKPKVTFDNDYAIYRGKFVKFQKIKWDNLQKVVIRTTDRGSMEDDLFWILVGKDEEILIIPSETEGVQKLMEEMQYRLDGFNNEEVIKSAASCENNDFLIWSSKDNKS